MSQTEPGTLALDPEQELLCACARANIASPDAARLQSMVERQLDWSRLVLLAQQHQIIPLLYRSLATVGALGGASSSAVPERVRTTLETSFYENLGRNLYLVDKLRTVIAAMAERDIGVVPLKGATLAADLYGDLSLRQFGDLDLLVRPVDARRAEQCLIEAGYQAGVSYPNEQNFTGRNGKVKVDLHWGLYRDRFCHINPEAWWDRRQAKVVFDTEMTLFAQEEALMMLCLNATKAYWDQSLRSLCDIAELLRGNPQLDWSFIHSELKKLRIEKMFTAALWLTEELLSVKLPQEFSTRNDRLRRNADPLFAVLRQHFFASTTQPYDRHVGSQWDLQKLDLWRDRASYRLRVHTVKLIPGEKDWAFLSLPRAVALLYYLVRPVRIVVERCRRRTTR